MNLLEVKNICKTYGSGETTVKALKDVSFSVPKGEYVAIVGESGSGKSTLLNMIGALDTPTSGKVLIDGKDIFSMNDKKLTVFRRRNIGFIFQAFNLVPELTVEQNIIFPVLLDYQKPDKKYLEELLTVLNLKERRNHLPSQLSGGQRQRVAFARALAPNPHLLLLDEPFAAIDAKVRQELRSWLKEMIEKLGITSIFVTHDQDEAIEVADEIIITNRGRIEQKGTPLEIYQNPQTAFAATFFGQTSQITNYQSFHSFPKVDNVDKAIIRPEFVKVSKKNEVQRFGPSASEGVVERVSFRGDSLELLVNVNDNQIIAKRGLEEKSIAVGEKVDVFIYRLFVTVGEKAMLLENQSLVDDSVFI